MIEALEITFTIGRLLMALGALGSFGLSWYCRNDEKDRRHYMLLGFVILAASRP